MDKPEFQGLALITGAARRLGKAIALALAQQGFAIGLHYNQSATSAHETAAELSRLGTPVQLFQADLHIPRQIDRLFEAVRKNAHPLKVLVNSAGVMSPGNLSEMSVEEWDDTLNMNLRAPWLCARAALRLMQPHGGVIINISDIAVEKAWTGYPAYSVSKAGLEMLTRLMARAFAPAVRVNAVAPGLILPAEGMDHEQWERLIQRVPARRQGQPEEIARAVLFLVENEYVTGDVLAVDGGYRLI